MFHLRTLSFTVVVLALVALTTQAVMSASSEKRPWVFGINRIGDSGILFGPPDYGDHVYQRINEIGGTNVRLLASPRDVERVRGVRDWSLLDSDLEGAIEYGLEPMVLICNTPAWASPIGEDTHLYPYKTELLPEFTDFCRELAERTKGKVKYFQIWNEQNGCSWHFHDGFNHADEYVPVLRAAYKGLKEGNPDSVVFLGGLDDAEGHGPIFMRKTYEERDKQFPGEQIFDGVTTHPYSDNPEEMLRKLNAIRDIMAANGDGDMPLWITEYGWNSAHMPEQARVDRYRDILNAFCQPDWDFLLGSISLSISDFEGKTTGFGVVDANLRPRDSFYAFQGAPRFGASPPHTIKWRPLTANSMEVTWKTVLPTEGRLRAALSDETIDKMTPLGTEHRVVLDKVQPATEYTLTITTLTNDWEQYDSASYKMRMPGKQVFNGDFESGFFAGVAEEWSITGEGFCTDVSLIPDTIAPNGEHAQAVFAYGDKDQKLNSMLKTYVAAEEGKKHTLAAKWASEVRDSGASVLARMGIDPTGGDNPDASTVVWTDWQTPGTTWVDVELPVDAQNSIMGIYFQCRSEGDLGDGMAFFFLDDVTVSSE